MKQFIAATMLFMLAVLTSCSKENDQNNGKDLYQGSPTWTIIFTDWRYISNENDTLVDLTDDILLNGSFTFDKENEGFFAIHFSPTNLTDPAYNLSSLPFTWYVKDGITYIIGEYDVLGSSLAPIVEHKYSFSGRISEDLTSISLDGYFHQENMISGQEEHHSLFLYLVAEKQ